MVTYKGYSLHKRGDLNYKEWSMEKWKSLQNEKGFHDTLNSNIRIEVFNIKVGSEWLLGRYNGLTPTTLPAPDIFNEAVKKHSKLEVANLSQTRMQYDARVTLTLDRVIHVLEDKGPFASNFCVPEILVVFEFDSVGNIVFIPK